MNGDGDALLVDSSKIGSDGSIDGNALFGDVGGDYEHGYQKMAEYDANQDGSLSGDELKNIALWVDDGDAKLEEGELRSLSEAGIESLGVNAKNVANERGENLIVESAGFSDGSTAKTEDVFFWSKDK